MTASMPVRPVARRMLRIRSLVLFMSGMFYYSYRTASDFLQEIGEIYDIIGQVVLQGALVPEFHQ